jgi:UDP-GlcNAc:undecaprenyl-phosphate GlcNAc-1-phosphate transferase
MSPLLQQFLVAFISTLAAITALARLAPAIGLVDVPDDRKLHKGQVPLVGGIAIFLSLALGALLWGGETVTMIVGEAHSIWVFMSAGAVLVILGILDDRSHVSVFTRVMVEIAVALIIIEGLDLQVRNLGNLLGTGSIVIPVWLAYPFTVICIFGVINAFNMLDGMDGLLGIMMLITLGGVHLFAGIVPGFVSVFIGSSLLAFLVSNLKLSPFIPKSFLGDAGSKLLGFIVVSLLLAASSSQIGGKQLIRPVTALYIVGLPLFDMVFTTLRRLGTRRSPFSSDRSHIHHLMQALGMSNRRALLVIGSIGLCCPLLGLMLSKSGATTPYQFYIFFGCFVMYCVLMSQAWKVAEKLKRIDSRAKLAKTVVEIPKKMAQ